MQSDGNARLTHYFSTGDSHGFKEGVSRMAQLLKVPPHPDDQITLEACCKLIEARLNQTAFEKSEKVVGSVINNNIAYPCLSPFSGSGMVTTLPQPRSIERIFISQQIIYELCI